MTTDETDFFRDVFDEPDQRPRESGAAMRLRGQSHDGLVRTTGWLRLGRRQISSGLVAAVMGLLVALVPAVILLPRLPLVSAACVVGGPLCCVVVWWLSVRRFAPASRARTIGTRQAGRLVAGQWIRLYGRNGPIGQVASVRTRDEDVVVEFTGGATRTWPATEQVYVAELR
jgi:hypothetical protein